MEKLAELLATFRRLAHNPNLVVVHLKSGSTVIRVWCKLEDFKMLHRMLQQQSFLGMPFVRLRWSNGHRPRVDNVAPWPGEVIRVPLGLVVDKDSLRLRSDSPLAVTSFDGSLSVRVARLARVQFSLADRLDDRSGSILIQLVSSDHGMGPTPWTRRDGLIVSPAYSPGAKIVVVMLLLHAASPGVRSVVRTLRGSISVTLKGGGDML